MKAENLASQKKKSGLYLDHKREPTKGFSRKPLNRDFPGGLAVKTLRSQCRGPGVRSLVRELDSTCHNEDPACHN